MNIFYYFIILLIKGGPGSPLMISLNLSRNENIKSKLKMESGFVTNLTYSINVYQIKMKRESI